MSWEQSHPSTWNGHMLAQCLGSYIPSWGSVSWQNLPQELMVYIDKPFVLCEWKWHWNWHWSNPKGILLISEWRQFPESTSNSGLAVRRLGSRLGSVSNAPDCTSPPCLAAVKRARTYGHCVFRLRATPYCLWKHFLISLSFSLHVVWPLHRAVVHK